MNGETTDENVCGAVIVNGDEDKDQAVDEGHDEEGDAVNDIKVNKVDYVPISEKTQGYPDEVNNGDGVVNMEETTSQEVPVKDDEAMTYVLDIKDVNTREENKSLKVVPENMVDGGVVAYAEKVNDGGGVADANETTTQEVPMKDNETVISGLDIKDVNTREERKSSEVVTNIIVDGGGLANPEEVNDGGCIANTNETAPQELPVEDNEIVIYGLEIADVNTAERKSLDAVKDDMIDGSLAVSVHQTKDKFLIDNMPNEKEADTLNVEVPVGTIWDNGKRECRKEDASIAPNIKETPDNFRIPKRKPLNRKVFEKKMVLDNNEASMSEAKALSSIGNGACNGENEADSNEHVKNDDNAEVKPRVGVSRRLRRVRTKEVPEAQDGIIAANDEPESKPTNNEPQNKQSQKTDTCDLNNEEAEKSGDRISQLQRRKDREAEKEHTIEVAAKRSKSSKGVDCLGMIFMCNSETKEDCYRYRVLGLPGGKKDMVLKICKGMRLFLFDFNLKMMYGIYKAAGPGGYNIELRAFRSQFPSQVRFTILEDCVPLAEEKFRSVIKDNYYTKNKFNCQLTSKQVKKLCKLFHETTERAKTKLVLRNRIAAAPLSVHQDRKRKRVEDGRRAGPISSLEQQRSSIQLEEGARHYPMVISEVLDHHPINYERHVIYERETYLRSRTPPPLYQPLRAQNTPHSPSLLYSGAPILDMYRRDLAPEHHEPSLCECGRPHEMDHHDPYVSYVEAHAYQEPAYDTGAVHAYQEPAYETGISLECQDCYSDIRQVEYYRRAEYPPPLPPYRRY